MESILFAVYLEVISKNPSELINRCRVDRSFPHSLRPSLTDVYTVSSPRKSSTEGQESTTSGTGGKFSANQVAGNTGPVSWGKLGFGQGGIRG